MNLYRIENLEYGDECFVVAESKEAAHELSIFKDVEYVSITILTCNITIQEQLYSEEDKIVLSEKKFDEFIEECKRPSKPPTPAMQKALSDAIQAGYLDD